MPKIKKTARKVKIKKGDGSTVTLKKKGPKAVIIKKKSAAKNKTGSKQMRKRGY